MANRPSPYRFRRAASPRKDAKPEPTPAVDQTGHDLAQHTPTHQQFAAAPRFALKKARPQPTSRPSSPPKATLVKALRASGRIREDVDEPSGSNGDAGLAVHGEAPQVAETIERPNHEALVDLPYSPKRRRLDDGQDDHAMSARPVFRTGVPPITRPPVRFAPTQSSITTSTEDEHASSRPAFLRNSLAPRDAPIEPLPEVFSPHRRGQKFLPGGTASTVQQWVIEAGQGAVQSRRAQAHLKGDDFVLKIKVIDVSGDGPFVTCAYTAEGEQIMILLVQTASHARGQNSLRQDSVVGIRAPTWTVQVEGAQWSVAIDWKLLT